VTTKKSIEFSYNWNNKLHCKCFTTLRLSGRFEVGDMVDTYLKNKRMGLTTVVVKKEITFDKITDGLAYLDIGANAKECQAVLQKMYPHIVFTNQQPIYFYIFMYVEKEITAEVLTLF
jgi:hypothetical protein